MELTCVRCEGPFDAPTARGYCPTCVGYYRDNRRFAHAKANPAPGVHVTGQFLHPELCPQTVADPASGRAVCGLCGGEELDSGYGFAGGYGLGVYQFCLGCNAVLDFCTDSGD